MKRLLYVKNTAISKSDTMPTHTKSPAGEEKKEGGAQRIEALKEILKTNPEAQGLWDTLGKFPEISEDIKYREIELIFVEIPAMQLFHIRPDELPIAGCRIFYEMTWDRAHDLAYRIVQSAAKEAPDKLNADLEAMWVAANDTAQSIGRGEAAVAVGEAAAEALIRVINAAVADAPESEKEAIAEAAGYAILDAPQAAALVAEILIVADQKDKDGKDMRAHLAHAETRLRAWTAGLEVPYDFNDKLYAFYAPSPANLRRKGQDRASD
jgi:hypothetical protein